MIQKIKIKGKETEVYYFLPGATTEKTTKVYSAEERAPEFTKSLTELVPMILKFIELPLHFAAEENIIKEIEFHSSEVRGAFISAKLKIKNENFLGLLEIKTPQLWYQQVGDSIPQLVAHAENFINGKRAQADMFANNDNLHFKDYVDKINMSEVL